MARNAAKDYGFQYGYQDGFQYGLNAQSQGFNYDYRSSQEFQYADRGYDQSMGEHDDFQGAYRNGYKAGYDDGFYGRPSRYDSYGRYPGNNQPYSRNNGDADDYRYGNGRHANERYQNNPYGGYRNGGSYGRNAYGSPANDFGYRDGVAQGQKDRSSGKDFRPQKSDNYGDANHGYRKEFGDKNYYKGQYRQAFARGYEDGYGR
jgi:hypothetical protein